MTVWVANGHPVTGWVRNEPDGDVLLEVQGERDAIQAFLKALRERLEGFIHRETTAPSQLVAGETEFEIRR